MADIALVLLISALVLVGAGALIALALERRRKRKARGNPDPSRDYARRTSWGPTSGKLNFSAFVYMDVDGDGTYSLGDRPMAGIMVRLYDEHGGFLAASASNAAGFANFPASAKRRSAVIGAPGGYRFSVSVPPGWRATGGNAEQTARLVEVPGSSVGLVVREGLPRPVGLAPGRSVSSRMPGTGGATLSTLSKGQVLESRALRAEAAFRFPLAIEADEIVIAGGGLDRRLKLSAYPVDLGLLAPGALPSEASLTTIGFDDITTRGLCKVPSGHAGLDWHNLNAMSRDHTKNSEGYVNGNVSGSHIAYTSSGHPAEFGRVAAFGFHSVMLTAAWLRSEGEVALIESFLGEELIASDEVVLSALAPVQYAPMLKAVTRVRISTEHYWQAVMDDLVVAL